jgi:hypothetical protein
MRLAFAYRFTLSTQPASCEIHSHFGAAPALHQTEGDTRSTSMVGVSDNLYMPARTS